MLVITIRDKKVAEEQSSPYLVTITSWATAYSAYETIEEFVREWHDTLAEVKLNSNSFVGQKAITLMADWNVQTVYEYSEGLRACIDNGARACRLLSNGSMQKGAILVDTANRQTTFFRLNPNDKESIR